MHVNYEYVIDKAKLYALHGVILDYGCGSGDVVQAGNDIGLNIVGVEAFYEGSKAKEHVISKGLLGNLVFPLKQDYTIPFPDNSFDLIISNQVMEHIKDLNCTIKEIKRVLKPDGMLITLFPDKCVIREGHCGVPFSHWFSSESIYRYPYMRFMRFLGLGYHKRGKSQKQWVIDFIEWLDLYTSYKPLLDIKYLFSVNGFTFDRNEFDYMNYRLNHNGVNIPAWISKMKIWKMTMSIICRYFGGLVIVATKK